MIVEEACPCMKLVGYPMKAKIEVFFNFCLDDCRDEACPWMKLVGYPMKAKIEFFSDFCPEKCRGGLSMDDFYSYANRNDCTYFLRLLRTNF